MPYLAKTIGKYQSFAQFIRIETFACPVDNTHLAVWLINVTARMTLASCSTYVRYLNWKAIPDLFQGFPIQCHYSNFRLLSMAHKFSATFFQKRPNSVPQSLGGLLFHNCRGSSLFLKEWSLEQLALYSKLINPSPTPHSDDHWVIYITLRNFSRFFALLLISDPLAPLELELLRNNFER